MRFNSVMCVTVAAMVSVAGSVASATVVTAAGQQLGVGGALRTTTVTKTLDTDGDQAYGSAGWEFFGVGGGNIEGPGFEERALIGLPSFITDVTSAPGGASVYAAYYGYALMDDPRLAIGASVDDVVSGFAYAPAVPFGEERLMFRIVVGQDAPWFRVGFLVNQEYSFQQYPSQLRLQSGDSSALLSINMGTGLGNMDMYFFDVTGAAPGDIIDVYATCGTQRGNIAISGMTFDVIPAPGAAGLTALGVLAASRRRR